MTAPRSRSPVVRASRFSAAPWAAVLLLLICACTTPEPPPGLPTQSTSDSSAPPPAGTEGRSFMRPAAGKILARFDGGANKGLDFAGNRGDPVLAAASGRVSYAGSAIRGYGQMIVVIHNRTYSTAYAH